VEEQYSRECDDGKLNKKRFPGQNTHHKQRHPELAAKVNYRDEPGAQLHRHVPTGVLYGVTNLVSRNANPAMEFFEKLSSESRTTLLRGS
jgi:hypothetical protein